MSVFRLMKRRQAKEDKVSAKQAGKQAVTVSAPPKYRHVPTHAAADALLNAPAGWMRGEAERIRESTQKRLALAMSMSESRLPSSNSSTSMLSPLHINMHASGSSSSASSIRGTQMSSLSSSRRNSSYRKTIAVATTPGSASGTGPEYFSSIQEFQEYGMPEEDAFEMRVVSPKAQHRMSLA